jgi:hypothetical protein
MSDIVQTGDAVDELVTDEGAVVLVKTPRGHNLVRLSVLGQLIRVLAAEGIPLDDLVDELESRLGPAEHGESRQLVAEAVAALEADGLVSRSPSEHANTRNKVGDKL